MRFFTSFLTLVVLLLCVFFAFSYFDSKYLLVATDAEYAKNTGTQLLELFLIVSIAAAMFLSLLIYSVLSTQNAARRMAYAISKDMSFSKEQFRRFYELSPVPYLLISPKGTITRPNKASLRFFGRTEEDLIDKNIFSFLSLPEHSEKIMRYKDSAERRIPVEQKEVQVLLDSKELRWALLSIEDITTPGSHEHNCLVTLVDIHEQKELERIKTEFLSLASHQLRSPLANLKWYIDFLLNRRRDQMSEEVQGYLHKMFRRNSDMIELVNTLLNLSRIEMGRVKVEKESADVEALTKSVIEELEPTALEKKIVMETTFVGDLQLDTDTRLVRIILQNLLSNSLRYTKENGKVFIRLSGSTSRIRFEVEDTGVGIPPNEQGSIFSKLYRATNAKEIEANGNGIGLYMCKELVEGLGGTITFVSKLGEGTTFTFELPR
ncbi:MAG: Multi-sensor Signal Transduction Histidine Kinase [Parcubacteria group bacterium GW2011_GWC2_42_11]|nr:MAG: Multi-sensor Signal Transduction Histidine Kinase [Parcubacteria group bacterium GW2011_GWC2_42_11]